MQGILSSILLTLTAPRALRPTVAALTGVVARSRAGARAGAATVLEPIGADGPTPFGPTPFGPTPFSPTPAGPAPHAPAPFSPAPADPEGIRVVPYRPTTAWPEARRVHPRVYDPFRAFPRRASCLADLIHPRDPRD